MDNSVHAHNFRQLPSGAPDDGTTIPHQQPSNLEAEESLLGAILINNDALDQVSDFLEDKHFYEPLHGRIYDFIARLVNTGRLASEKTLKSFFEDDEALKEVGGVSYLGRLVSNATTTVNAGHYGHLVYEEALRREMIRAAEDILSAAYTTQPGQSPLEQLENAEQILYSVAERERYEGGFQPFDSALASALDMAANAFERDGHLSGLPTGLTDLDHLMGGLQPSDLVIIAGRPAMGKTALATNIACNVAKLLNKDTQPNKKNDNRVVGFFSLEMSSEQLATRIISETSEIPSERIRRGRITADEFHQLRDASEFLGTLPLFIDATGALNISRLAARARRLKRQHGLDLIVVDYLQLAAGNGRFRNENRVQEVSEVTQGLKALAKELSVPIVALSQLSRAVEQRDDKRPQLADLRESGSIEQDADVVLFVYREEYYLERAEPLEGTEEHDKWRMRMDRVHGLAEVIIGKQRHGPTGVTRLAYQANLTRFTDLAQSDHIPEERL